jgi:ligand-binding SRPBCC domain-containing protein
VDIDAPVETVFAFHERPDALALLSPTFPPLKVLRRTGGIGVGAEVDLKIGPITWLARHTAFERNRVFVDEQSRGPFKRWVHRHEFEDLGHGRSRLTDRVSFELPGGRLVNLIAAPLVMIGLRRMFAHRHAVTRRLLPVGRDADVRR